MADAFAPTPEPPYYAVIFSSRTAANLDGYAAMAGEMLARALAFPGCFGAENARGADGFGITVSYWADAAAVAAWKAHARHLLAQRLGQTRWYEHYVLRVARVERDYEGPTGRPTI